MIKKHLMLFYVIILNNLPYKHCKLANNLNQYINVYMAIYQYLVFKILIKYCQYSTKLLIYINDN